MLLAVSTVAGAPDGVQIKKPTQFLDLEGATQDPQNATDFLDRYNQNTSARTTSPSIDPSINWTDWDTTDRSVYSDLTLDFTVSASGFDGTFPDTWAVYYDNTTDTVCDSTDRVLKSSGSDNIGLTNYSVVLPRTQDLSLLEVCLVGQINTADDGGQVNTFDIRTEGTEDQTAPRWRNQVQNRSAIVRGEPIELAAQGRDAVNLSRAVLATNETGEWGNKSAYGLSKQLYTQNEWTWSNFTWSNTSTPYGTSVGWRIWYNDTAGNYNRTDTTIFRVKTPYLAVNLTDPPGPLTVAQNQTFLLNATITCRDGDCGTVNASGRYNASSTVPDTLIPASSGKPFYTEKTSTVTCQTDLREGQTCNATWTVNATGDIGSFWAVDVNATANTAAITDNDTRDVTIEIVDIVIGLELHWDIVDFGGVTVGTQDNPAQQNDASGYNITVDDSTTTNVDLWINGSDLVPKSGSYRIGVGNASWSLTNDPATETPLSPLFAPLASDVSPGTNTTTHYWLDMPTGIRQDTYNGTIQVRANETA